MGTKKKTTRPSGTVPVTFVYVLCILLEVLAGIAHFANVTDYLDISPRQHPVAPDLPPENLIYMIIGLESLGYLLLAAWAGMSNDNLRALRVPSLRFTPGWATGYFLIPFWNLIRVPQIVGEVWTESNPKTHPAEGHEHRRRTPAFVQTWWFLYVLSPLISLALTSVLYLQPDHDECYFAVTAQWLVLVLPRFITLVLVWKVAGRLAGLRKLVASSSTDRA
jgi:hypothetical protein